MIRPLKAQLRLEQDRDRAAVRPLRLPPSCDRVLLPGQRQTTITVSTQPAKL